MPENATDLSTQIGGIPGGKVSFPMVHPSWSAQQTLDYWLQKEHNTNDLVTAMDQGMTPDNYMEIMSKRASNGDVSAIEWLANKYATEDSEKTAREWTAKREDTAYQRLVSDLQKAGISPYILSGGSAIASGSSGHSYSGSQMVSQENSKRSNKTEQQNTAVQSILRIVGVLGAALMYTMLS